LKDRPRDPKHEYLTLYCRNCGHHYAVPVPCKNRFCAVCCSIRFSKIRRRLNGMVEKQKSQPNQDIRFLTLTITSEHNIDSMVNRIQKSFRRLRQRARWKRRVTGGAFVIEITRPGGKWHAHIHAIICGSYFPFKSLLDQWMQVSTGRGVYIKKIPAGVAVNYLNKYMTKPDYSLSEDDQLEVSHCLKKARLFQPFGTWHGWQKELKNLHPACKSCGSTTGFTTGWEFGYCESPSGHAPLGVKEFIEVFIDPF